MRCCHGLAVGVRAREAVIGPQRKKGIVLENSLPSTQHASLGTRSRGSFSLWAFRWFGVISLHTSACPPMLAPQCAASCLPVREWNRCEGPLKPGS